MINENNGILLRFYGCEANERDARGLPLRLGWKLEAANEPKQS